MKNSEKVLSNLTPEQLVEIISDVDNTTGIVKSDAFIRKLASEIFECEIDNTNWGQFSAIINLSAFYLARELKKRL